MAEVWPSRLALVERRAELGRESPGGLLLRPDLYTFEGSHGLLAALTRDLDPPWGRRPLPEMGGPLLLHRLLRESGQGEPLFSGLAAGRRLPHRLWRLLVQIKAAGLQASDIKAIAQQSPPSPRLAALARLLARYQDELERLGLLDEADVLAHLEAALVAGRRPGVVRGWRQGLQVRGALWLRPLDLRLLKALARAVPVTVEFALLEPPADPRQIFRLLRRTADYLESGAAGELEVTWTDLARTDGPLAELVRAGLDPQAEVDAGLWEQVRLWRAPGRYAEVEALVGRALELVEQGAPAHGIALVFPDLNLYGQMVADAAGRLGLPVSFRRGEPLAAAPLVQAFLALLELPLAGFPRPALARVWESPYLGPGLSALAGQRLGEAKAPRAGRLLAQAGYVDSRETPVRAWLERAAERGGRDAPDLRALGQACAWLTGWLEPLARPQSLPAYAERAARLLAELDMARFLGVSLATGQPGPEQPGCPTPAAVHCRDLAALSSLTQALRDMAQAAGVVAAHDELNPGRLLALLREALGGQALAEPQAAGGVAVLRLEDAQGLKLHTALVGGLTQEGFPQRPGQHLLSRQERLALGRRAGLPVWRTEEEEYSGQVLRLLLLLASVIQGAVLACPAADAQGRELAPAFILSDLALRREQAGQAEKGKGLTTLAGGVYGDPPPLHEAREPLGLWAGLSRALAGRRGGTSQEEAELAQAALWAAAKGPGATGRWQSLVSRARTEEERAALDLLGGQARALASGPFSGRVTNPGGLGLVGGILAQPGQRRFSPKRLEAYAACPQAWFFQYLLHLERPDAPGWDLERSREGEWVHKTLALFFAPGEYDPAWTPGERAARLQACLDQAWEELAREGQAGHPLVGRARREGLLQALTRVVEAECQAMEGFAPLGVEEDLSELAGGMTLAVDQGPPLELTGRLDRRDGSEGAVRVTDYKHGNNPADLKAPLRQEDWGVTAFQMPVYLAAARQAAGEGLAALEARVTPTRRLGDTVKPVVLGGDAPFLAQDQAHRQALAQEGAPNLFNGIAALWQRLSGGDWTARPSQDACRFCDFGRLCRARAAVLAEGEANGEGGDA